MKVDEDKKRQMNQALLNRCTERVAWFGVVNAEDVAASVIDEINNDINERINKYSINQLKGVKTK